MATVYSLLCWGGHTGKSVSLNASTDLVTLTNHGLRSGAKLWVSGSMPAELNVLTPVYARAASTSTFTLHPTAADAVAGTNQILIAGSATYSITAKSSVVAEPAVSLAFSGLSDLSRWYDSGLSAYRIYDSLAAWNTARGAAALRTNEEVCEIAEAWSDTVTTTLTIAVPAGAVTVTSKVNGVRSPACHGGVYGYGYWLYGASGSANVLAVTSEMAALDGWSVMVVGGWYSSNVLNLNGFLAEARWMICAGGYINNGAVIRLNAAGSKAIYCLAVGGSVGIYCSSYLVGLVVANCTATKNYTGIGGVTYAPTYGYYYNNVSIGNTTANWTAGVYGQNGASNNVGGAGEAWVTAGGSIIEVTEASPFGGTFADWTNNDYRPASVSSALADAAVEYYGALPSDLSGAVVPSYAGGGSEARDCGCYEFDRGYGPHPATFTLTLTNLVSGSSIRIEESDGTLIEYRTAAATSEVFTMDASLGVVTIKVRKGSSSPFYQPYDTQTTAFDGAQSIYISQIHDE